MCVCESVCAYVRLFLPAVQLLEDLVERFLGPLLGGFGLEGIPALRQLVELHVAVHHTLVHLALQTL